MCSPTMRRTDTLGNCIRGNRFYLTQEAGTKLLSSLNVLGYLCDKKKIGFQNVYLD